MNGNGKSAIAAPQRPGLPPGVGTNTASEPISGTALTNGKKTSNLVKKHVISLYVNNKPGALIRIALPPRTAGGENPHAVAHAILKDTRERANARQADDQRLQNADLGIGIHDQHQSPNGVGGHNAVAV